MNEEKIIQKLFEHDDRFDSFDGQFNEVKKQILTSHEEIIAILKRLDEERIFTIEWVKRIENEVAEQKKKIQEHDLILQKIKTDLHITI